MLTDASSKLSIFIKNRFSALNLLLNFFCSTPFYAISMHNGPGGAEFEYECE